MACAKPDRPELRDWEPERPPGVAAAPRPKLQLPADPLALFQSAPPLRATNIGQERSYRACHSVSFRSQVCQSLIVVEGVVDSGRCWRSLSTASVAQDLHLNESAIRSLKVVERLPNPAPAFAIAV